jgi:hypothetical protein
MTDSASADKRLEEIFEQFSSWSTVDLESFKKAICAVREELQPQIAPPTQRQLLMLASLYWPEGNDLLPAVRFARAVLARWGSR